MGRSPAKVWAERERDIVGDDELEQALTVRADRQVRADGTLSIGGQDWELEDGWLAGHKLTIARSFVDLQRPPWIEHEGKRLPLRLVDPVANGRRRRVPTKRTRTGLDAVVYFDVSEGELLRRLTGRRLCRACGTSFHLVSSPPRRAGTCDACGGELYQREDDAEATVRNRLAVYARQTAPLLDHYRSRGLLSSVRGEGRIEGIRDAVRAAVTGGAR